MSTRHLSDCLDRRAYKIFRTIYLERNMARRDRNHGSVVVVGEPLFN